MELERARVASESVIAKTNMSNISSPACDIYDCALINGALTEVLGRLITDKASGSFFCKDDSSHETVVFIT